MTVLCWDIDGTLLTTQKAGIASWEEAVKNKTGADVDFELFKTDGKTDMEIAVMIYQHLRKPCSEGELMDLVAVYSDGLAEALAAGRRGMVLPGVKAILDLAESKTGVENILLTGNTEAGARAKLKHYGLDDYFSHGSFSCPLISRKEIAERAVELVGKVFGPEQDMYVIGDTPFDIECGKHIGARTIAVGSGVYSKAQLEEYTPWWCLGEFPAADEFFHHLGRRG